ncbi:MAG: thiazole synthase [Epsilonproteobacteria bacterium]|nr:thiazole synthase [Campylobacterota bacterium]
MSNDLVLGGVKFTNRLFTGTGKFPDKNLIPKIINSSGSKMITVALRRVDFDMPEENILEYIPKDTILLPNTSGARNAKEAVKIALIAREAGCGNFIKIEVINDMKYLLPDNEETIKATQILAKEGFTVLPYVMPDLTVAKKLQDAGASAVMPLGSPIGSNQGLQTKSMIKILIDNISLPIVVDAGIGKPSQAAEAMEMGADAVLVNSAIANAGDPETMAKAFSMAVEAGRMAYEAKLASEFDKAVASSPLTGFLHD